LDTITGAQTGSALDSLQKKRYHYKTFYSALQRTIGLQARYYYMILYSYDIKTEMEYQPRTPQRDCVLAVKINDMKKEAGYFLTLFE